MSCIGDLIPGIQNYLAINPTIISLVGSTGGESWVLQDSPQGLIEGTGGLALVLSLDGSWRSGMDGSSVLFPKVMVEVWADPARDEDGVSTEAVSVTRRRALNLWWCVDTVLHRSERGSISFSGVSVVSSQRLTEPVLECVPDGSGLVVGVSHYAMELFGGGFVAEPIVPVVPMADLAADIQVLYDSGWSYLWGGDTLLTLSATGISNVESISINGNLCTDIYFTAPYTISVPTPSSDSLGVFDIVVTFTDSSVITLTDAFEYREYVPTVTSVSPTTGGAGGGTLVTIQGTNLQYASQVWVDNGITWSVSYSSNELKFNTISFTSTGAKEIRISFTPPVGYTEPDLVLTETFTADLSDAPTAELDPLYDNRGTQFGGSLCHFIGTNLGHVTNVLFDGVPMVSWYGARSETTFMVVVPGHSAGFVDVTLVCNTPYSNFVIPNFEYFEIA